MGSFLSYLYEFQHFGLFFVEEIPWKQKENVFFEENIEDCVV